MKKNLPIIFDYLKELFPTPETELHYSTPFQFVVAVMLSAQATDVQVNKVTDKLFNHIGISNIPIDKNDVKVSKETSGVVLKKIKNPEDLLTMGFANFERSISSINYYKTKAKHIFQTAKILIERSKIPRPKGHLPLSVKGVRHGIPDTLEELMKLPGVGVKTGKLIAHVLYDKPYIAVDTHIHRVSNRL